MIYIIKKIIRNALDLLERVIFAGLRSSRFSSWYENQTLQQSYPKDVSDNTRIVVVQPEWRKVDKVRFSGVGVLSEAKVIICQPSGVNSNDAVYRKAIVCTKYYRPLMYPGAHSVLRSLMFVQGNLNIWFKGRRSGRLPGKVVLLGNYVYLSSNYYHFWTDVIADIWYVRKNLPSSELPDSYLVPFAGLAWQWDILRLCGLRDDQIIPYSRYDILSLEELIIPVRDKGAVNLPPWLSSAIQEMSGWSPRTVKGERLIFVSRADATRRRVVNEVDIRERLVQEGFEVYTLDGLSFSEQQFLFSSAAIICSPHGAALTNLVWCGPGTIVIDLLSEQHLLPCFKELAEQNQVKYYPCVCKKVENSKNGLEGDIMVSDYQIEFVMGIVSKHLPLSNNMIDASNNIEEFTK